MWRSLLAAIGVIVVSTGVAAAPGPATPARLTIDARTGPVTSVLVPSEASLRCDRGSNRASGTGFLRNAAGPACALVRRGVLTKVVAAHRQTRLCSQEYGGPQLAHIRGASGGRRVEVTITRADGCGVDEWNQMRALLGAPERQAALPRPSRSAATTTTTAPTVTYRVQRGDTLTEIAHQFHTSVAAIIATNQLADPNTLTEGQPLVMPPPSAVRIAAELVDGRADTGFTLVLAGAQPSELVTFVITLPDATTFTGSPHLASSDGAVTTTYRAQLLPGTYTVTATGSGGTSSQAAFRVVEPD